MSANLAALLYLVAGVLFILSLRGLSSPATSRQGNLFGMIGMGVAVVTTLMYAPPSSLGSWLYVIGGIAIGGGIGAWRARTVKMTDMPQLVAFFHALVGLAAVLVAAGALNAPQAFGLGAPGRISSVVPRHFRQSSSRFSRTTSNPILRIIAESGTSGSRAE